MDDSFKPRNFIDRAIEAVVPTFAAKRYAARAVIDFARNPGRHERRASARGAMATRTSIPWGTDTTYRGGRTSERHDLGTQRDRARRIYDESAIGGGLLDTETDNIVADGFSLQMLSSSPAFNAEAEDRFYKWLDKADVQGLATGAELFRDSWREPRKDGDGGILLIKQGGRPYLQYIPGDLITNPYGRVDYRVMRDGVEVDASGKPVRFWIRDVDESGKDAVNPVPARDFVYLAYQRKKLSIRGSTVYRRIFSHLDQVDSYVDGVTKAAILATIFGLIHRVNKPGQTVSQFGTLTNAQGNDQKAITLENGLLRVEGTAESTYQVQAQQPMQQTPDFIRALLRLICLAFDMPLEIGQKDLSQVNFSGGRIGLIGYYRSCRVKQDWLKSRCWNRIVFWWLSVEKQRKDLGFDDAFVNAFPPDYGAFELHGREWDYNDPKTEITADLIEMDAGILSEQQACERRGRDWAKTQRLIAEARKIKGELGIPVVHSTNTRDETAKVTAVDKNGNPIDAAPQPLNGAQITAAIDVMARAREGALSDDAASELLAQVGIEKSRATTMVTSLSKLTAGAGDVEFKREILKQLLAVPAAREAVYNGTDIEDLIAQTGLAPEKGYEVPWIPVVAPTGPLVSGATINDPEGDIVGGDVENDVPDELPEQSEPVGNSAPAAGESEGKQDDSDEDAE